MKNEYIINDISSDWSKAIRNNERKSRSMGTNMHCSLFNEKSKVYQPLLAGEWLFFEVYITQEDGKNFLDGLMCAMFCLVYQKIFSFYLVLIINLLT